MSSLIDIKTSTNRLLFDLRDVTFMEYHKNKLIIHHINEPAISAYQVDLSQEQFDDLIDNVSEILLYLPPGNMTPDGALTFFFASHIKNVITAYSMRPRVPNFLRIDYPNKYVTVSVDNDTFYNLLWSSMKIAESHAMTR